MQKDLFARIAIAQIPKILTLMDRNPHSPTYGCCDRAFWHYKILDFPSGMSQEFVWCLALAYATNCPDNPYYQQPACRDWVDAGILYAARSAHQDGSCDDYFPFERAGGAAAFSLLACIESYALLDLDNPAMLEFFARRAEWLAHHDESGRLTNHQALIVLCLERLGKLLSTSQWDRAKSRRLERILDWQSEEGWFPEYEGCDPGYHTLTIACLASIYMQRADERIKESLIAAVDFAGQFLHPDGSYGGEYTSRNTYNFFPHGFELVGKWYPDALRVNGGFLLGLERGLGPCYWDDRILGHHAWNYLLAWRDFVAERPPAAPRSRGRLWFQDAQILIDRRADSELYLALNKGGTFKLFRHGKLIASDTQFSLAVRQGNKLQNAVGHLVDRYDVEIDGERICIRGHLGWAKQTQMTTAKLIILRLAMFGFGRFFPNLIRRILQKLLIVGKKQAPYRFQRILHWQDDRLLVSDTLHAQSWNAVERVGIGCDQTSIYVVMSRTFQRGQLQPWLDLSTCARACSPAEPLRCDREL
ncbi:hypothetical protein KR51_00031140 [Rubidibacter lacunae KORDI 51-2]|uniref:Heparinase II/III-like protein n=1 Tax=Rubidibacter lacunae KORDI 51-2 TaxID=582515 RepID=U5DG47_9CHRO|nr:hypothetical protein [Rubidibacter lacunae]ERN40566.1 hypothetical protein KR51_00031140 [Rubidibacter lacunae KORDI 51-2]